MKESKKINEILDSPLNSSIRFDDVSYSTAFWEKLNDILFSRTDLELFFINWSNLTRNYQLFFPHLNNLKKINITDSLLTNIDFLSCINNLNSLTIKIAPNASLDRLIKFDNLQKLIVLNSGLNQDVIYSFNRLKYLRLIECSAFFDITKLNCKNTLVNLYINLTPNVVGFNSLQEFKNLELFLLTHFENLTDLSSLKNITNLKYLYLHEINNLRHIESLLNNKLLKEFGLTGKHNVDLKEFHIFKFLKDLALDVEFEDEKIQKQFNKLMKRNGIELRELM